MMPSADIRDEVNNPWRWRQDTRELPLASILVTNCASIIPRKLESLSPRQYGKVPRVAMRKWEFRTLIRPGWPAGHALQ